MGKHLKKIIMNYIIAEKQLKDFKNSLVLKYGKGFKGSMLTDCEIDKLQDLKQQLSDHTISKKDFLKQVVSR